MKIRNESINKNYLTPSIIFMLGIATVLGVGIYNATNIANTSNANALSYSTSNDISFTFAPTLSIGLSTDSLTIDNLVPGTTSDSNSVRVTVSSNTPYGYVLSAGVGSTVSSDPYYNTSDLVHDNSTTQVPTINKFSSIATSANLQTLDTDNTWGYSTSTDGGTSWSTYSGLSHAETKPLLDISAAAQPSTIDFKIAARSATTQASGTYNNVITFYAVGKPKPKYLYEEVAKMSKGTQNTADLQAVTTIPTSRDYREDTSNSGVYEYNTSLFGEASDASNANKIYYYRGNLEPYSDRGSGGYGSGGKSTTYPNYVKLDNNTCWRIVRTTGSGGVKMIYNGIWNGNNGSCGNIGISTGVIDGPYADSGSSSQNDWEKNIHFVGYTYNDAITDSTSYMSTDSIFGGNSNFSINSSDSYIKKYIEDNWFYYNLRDYYDLLEPSAGYCNDRTLFYSESISASSVSNYYPYYKYSSDSEVYFGANNRNNIADSLAPSLSCPGNRNIVDLYSTDIATNGNKQLKYPVGLLTADEYTLAKGGYLDGGAFFHLLSPSGKKKNFQKKYLATVFTGGNGLRDDTDVSAYCSIRPVVSLKPGTTALSGSGISTDPWVVPAP